MVEPCPAREAAFEQALTAGAKLLAEGVPRIHLAQGFVAVGLSMAAKEIDLVELAGWVNSLAGELLDAGTASSRGVLQ